MTDQAAPHHIPGTLHHRNARQRLEEMHTKRPVKVADGHVGINGQIALLITTIVGTMICAYIFALIALLSLPSALSSGNLTIIIAWISSNFLQLVLLPIIIVGQNIQSKAADKRAEETYKDAEAILHECIELQGHLEAQDKLLDEMVMHLQKVTSAG